MLVERLTAQLLAGERADDAVGVAERLLAVQAQDPRGARLAVRARATTGTAVDVDRALTEERTLLVSWLNRGTLHLVRREDYPWLHALTAPRLMRGNARRLADEGVSAGTADRAVRIIERALIRDGALTRAQLSHEIDAGGVKLQGQGMVHVLLLASLQGLIVRGPVVDRQQAFVLVRDWLGTQAPVDRDRALAELARRYLAGHGPAQDRDLARWSGLSLRDARAGLAAIAGELRERPDGLLDLGGRTASGSLPAPVLLGAFDPLLLGWDGRDWVLGAHRQEIVLGGIFRPFALVDGRAAATWSVRAGELILKPFAKLRSADRAALAAAGEEVKRHMGRRLPRT